MKRNFHEMFRSMRCKNREKYGSKKTITHDNIYVVRQFAYVYEVVGISLFLEKNTRYGNTIFSFKTTSNPNLQNNNFSIMCIEFTIGYKMGHKFFPALLYGLSLKKSPIKNYNNIKSPQSPTNLPLGD